MRWFRSGRDRQERSEPLWERDDPIMQQAVAWHDALRRDDGDWDAYILWLEADPRHKQATDQIAQLHAIMDSHKDKLTQECGAEAPLNKWPTIVHSGMVVGASAVLVACLMWVANPWLAPGDAIYATGPGETSRIVLASDMIVELAPGSRLVVNENNPTDLELSGGEALFRVRHNPDRILAIRLGGFVVRDIGTEFSANATQGAIMVAVAEGDVTVARDGADTSVALSAGQRLVAQRKGNTVISNIDRAHVGAWRRGQLVYDQAPLAIVAADISRYSGRDVVVADSLKPLLFSGVLAIGDGSNLVQTLASLMALRYSVDGNRIRIDPASGK